MKSPASAGLFLAVIPAGGRNPETLLRLLLVVQTCVAAPASHREPHRVKHAVDVLREAFDGFRCALGVDDSPAPARIGILLEVPVSVQRGSPRDPGR